MELLQRHIAPGAFHNSDERYDPPKCYPHTRRAVLKKIIDWVKDVDKVVLILWLYGPAGAGKSAIAQTIAELLEEAGLLAGASFSLGCTWAR
jgi:pantothenate kinase-related protein Tda10